MTNLPAHLDPRAPSSVPWYLLRQPEDISGLIIIGERIAAQYRAMIHARMMQPRQDSDSDPIEPDPMLIQMDVGTLAVRFRQADGFPLDVLRMAQLPDDDLLRIVVTVQRTIDRPTGTIPPNVLWAVREFRVIS